MTNKRTMHRIAFVAVLVAAAVACTGCGMGQLASAVFTGAKLSDAQLSGSVGKPEPIIVTGPDGEQAEIGCYLPLNILGEEEPLKVMLVGKYRTFCDLDLNRRVTVNGKPGPDGVIDPNRVNPGRR